ncbi:MAG: VWA domain-containing protein [Pseudomonadales bacterium]
MRPSRYLMVTVLALTACSGHEETVTVLEPDQPETPTAPLPVEGEASPRTTPAPVTSPGRQELADERLRRAQESKVSGAPIREAELANAAVDQAWPGSQRIPAQGPPSRWGTPENRENYRHVEDNPVRLTIADPVSTFSIDVDTAAYSNLRRLLNQGSLPPADAVRIEELINYFSYDYPAPDNGEAFNVITEVGPAPWNSERQLLHIGIQGKRLAADALPPANLVFLIDVSGSMQSPDKLDLLKASLKLLTRQLDAEDRISIAVYAGSAGAVLEPTAGNRSAEIDAAIDRLSAGGSTNGGAGIHLAYAMARQAFMRDGINRVILATDGDFNVGTTDQHALEDLVERERASGVALTVLGFGSGNYNDALMQRLAQVGNGNAAYVDTMNEARKVLVDELASTLKIIAKDVKIQVEFNPAVVAEYRLLGYETRMLAREDFNNDQVDAGEIGAGHTVTALYELTLQDSADRRVDPLRYQDLRPQPGDRRSDELAFVRLRHKAPDADASSLIEMPIRTTDMQSDLRRTSDDFRFSAAVAGFGSLLRAGAQTGNFSYDDVSSLALGARGADPFGYRGEFLGLVRTAQAL